MSVDQIARDFLNASGGDMRAALFRMAAVIDMARGRAEDAMTRNAMEREQVELLWRDLHPNRARDGAGS